MVTDAGTNESLVTIKSSPAISTQASETLGGVVGVSVLSDQAVQIGRETCRERVKFTITAPDSTTTQVGALETVKGEGTYSPTATVLVTLGGTETCDASYSDVT